MANVGIEKKLSVVVVKWTIFTLTLWGQLVNCGAIHTRKCLTPKKLLIKTTTKKVDN